MFQPIEVNMKSILVPTDFSPTALKAAEFAVTLANELGLELVLVNVFNLTSAFPYESPSMLELEIHESQVISEGRLTLLKGQLSSGCKQPIKTLSVYGVIPEVIDQVAQKTKAAFIVMGTRGIHDMWEQIMGSNSYLVVKNAPCPVFVIPDSATFSEMKNIVYASDYAHNEVKIVQEIVSIAEHFKAQTNILHVHDVDEVDLTDDQTISSWLTTEFENKEVRSTIFISEDPVEGIEAFIKKNQPDLLVLAMTERGYFENLIHKSVTKHFVQNFNLPLLIIPKG